MNYLLSLAISTALGFLTINLFSPQKPLDLLQKIVLSIGLGLGLSGQLVFYCLLVNDAYSPAFIGGLHAAAIVLLSIFNLRRRKEGSKKPKTAVSLNRDTLIGLAAVLLLLVPLWREAHFFPFGGWDAWSCWNLKARFIFYGGDHWKNMFDPALWRSNNHYPFLLPLINVWGWMFYNDAALVVPMWNAVIFSLLTALLIFASTARLTGHRLAFVPALLLFSLPFVNTLSISQYSDIVVAFYFLAALSALTQAKRDDHPGWAAVAGLSIGLLSFAKTEGTVASVIITALAFPFLGGKLFRNFAGAALVALLPTLIFKAAWHPANVAFINGLTSTDSPASMERLQAVFLFLAVELISLKWCGLWILLAIGLALGGKTAFRSDRWIVPASLVLFLAAALAYYEINTYFEVLWWLKTSLNRILYIILPALVWWVFSSLLLSEKK
jgi:hypothetical protein